MKCFTYVITEGYHNNFRWFSSIISNAKNHRYQYKNNKYYDGSYDLDRRIIWKNGSKVRLDEDESW